MKEIIEILTMRVGREPVAYPICNRLISMQDVVSGNLESVTLEPNVCLMCNEEGKIKGLKPNRHLPEINDTIHGSFFITRIDPETGESIDLTEADVKKYTEKFSL